MVDWIKYYTDEHVSKAVINGLRQRGLDVETTTEAGLLRAMDLEHLIYARDTGRVIFSQDDDFLRLHAQGHDHWGIVYASQRMAIGDLIRGLSLISQVLTSEDMENHVEFI
jgi:hypothetical protein